MAVMLTDLKPFSTLGNTRTYEMAGHLALQVHSALSPFIVIQKRKNPVRE